MSIATGEFACDNTHFDDCYEILTSSHADRVYFAKDFRNDHVEKVEDGKVKHCHLWITRFETKLVVLLV